MVASTAGFMPHVLSSHMMSPHPMYLPPMNPGLGGHFPEYSHLPDFFPRNFLGEDKRINDHLSGFKQEGRYSPPDLYGGGGGHVGIDPHFHFHYFPPPDEFPPGNGLSLPLGDYGGVNNHLGGMGFGMGHFSGLNQHLENLHPLPSINNFSPFGLRSNGFSGLDNPMSIPPPLIIPPSRSLSPGLGSGFQDFPPPSIIAPNRVSSPSFTIANGSKLPPMPSLPVDFPPSFVPPLSSEVSNLESTKQENP